MDVHAEVRASAVLLPRCFTLLSNPRLEKSDKANLKEPGELALLKDLNVLTGVKTIVFVPV